MKRSNIVLTLFITAALIQLYVPASMILSREEVLREGTPVRFKIIPIDPNDPFRGKYMNLVFDQNEFKIEGEHSFFQGQHVYALLKKDSNELVRIMDLSTEEPSSDLLYFETEIDYINTYEGTSLIDLEMPIDRYYLQEDVAGKVEQLFAEALAAFSQDVYAIVKLKDGQAVLEDVQIGGRSIRDLIEEAKKLKGYKSER